MGRRFNFQKTINGGLTNVAARAGARYLGNQWGPPVGAAAVGFMTGDETSQWMAGYLLGNQVPLGSFGAAPPSGGFF